MIAGERRAVDNRAARGVVGASVRCAVCPHTEHAVFDDCATLEARGARMLALLTRLSRHELVHTRQDPER